MIWLYQSCKKLFSRRNSRFFELTPPFLRSQLIWDRKRRSLVHLGIRDLSDYATLQQVYIWEDYRLADLARHDDILAAYRRYVAAGNAPLILDLGANIGLAARYFAEEFPEAKVIALEPDADNVEVARRNTGNVGNVSLFRAAVGPKDGKAAIINPHQASNSFRIVELETGTIEIISIRSLLARYTEGRTRPFIVKIDIEGYEKELFSGDTDWVDSFDVVIIELHDRMFPGSGSSRSFLSAISKFDRDFVPLGENIFSIANRLRVDPD